MGVNQSSSSLARKRELLYHGGEDASSITTMTTNVTHSTTTTSTTTTLNHVGSLDHPPPSSIPSCLPQQQQPSQKNGFSRNRASIGLLIHRGFHENHLHRATVGSSSDHGTSNNNNNEKKRFTISLFTRSSSSSKSPTSNFYEEDSFAQMVMKSSSSGNKSKSSAITTTQSLSEPSSPNQKSRVLIRGGGRQGQLHSSGCSPTTLLSSSFSASSSHGSSSNSSTCSSGSGGQQQPSLLVIPTTNPSMGALDGKIKSLSPSAHRQGYLSGLLKRRSKRSSSQPSTLTTTTHSIISDSNQVSSCLSSHPSYQLYPPDSLTDEENTLFSTMYPSINAKEVISLLRDPIGLELFYDYCSKQMCSENIELFKELEWLENRIPNLSSTSRVKHIKSIHEKFLSMESELEVNVSHHARQLIEKERHSKKIDVESTLTLVDFLKRDVCTNLFDAFSRFIQTKEYIQWREVKCMKYNNSTSSTSSSAPRSHESANCGHHFTISGNAQDEKNLTKTDPARISTSSCDEASYSFGSNSLFGNSVSDFQFANLTPPNLCENQFALNEHSDHKTLFTPTM
nr:unnamed protein product [Naegleria fowleri]